MTASSVFPFPLEFADSTWRSRFTDYGWNRFDSLWNLDATEVDTPNVRRGGWSSVVRMSAPDGSLFYLKRQQNHFYRDPKNFYRKTPTAVREWRSTKELGDAGIGVLNAVCMGMGVSHDASRAVFVTEALTDHRSLPETLQDPALSPEARVELWHALGHLIRRVHRRGYRYNCLYGKHVMLQRFENSWDIRLIDLEKATRVRSATSAMISDLSQLDRHTDDMSNRDRQDFWDAYFEDTELEARESALLKISRRTADRLVKQYLGNRRLLNKT